MNILYLVPIQATYLVSTWSTLAWLMGVGAWKTAKFRPWQDCGTNRRAGSKTCGSGEENILNGGNAKIFAIKYYFDVCAVDSN